MFIHLYQSLHSNIIIEYHEIWYWQQECFYCINPLKLGIKIPK
jgi:hypothetical protein